MHALSRWEEISKRREARSESASSFCLQVLSHARPLELQVSRLAMLSVADGAVVCQDAGLVGDITIGARTVIHPKCSIIAEGTAR